MTEFSLSSVLVFRWPLLFIVPFLKVNELRESKSEEFVIRGDSDRYYRVQVEGEKIGEGD